MIAPVTAGWQDQPCWRVLDTGFELGQHFFATWQRYLQHPRAPRLLHYVALCPQAPDARTLEQACLRQRVPLALARQLRSHWFGLLPGFHRFLLAQGRIVLTLCVGDALPALREQNFLADTLIVCTNAPSPCGALDLRDKWATKALASCCRRGTAVLADSRHLHLLPLALTPLRQAGFVIDTNHPVSASDLQLVGHFAPAWRVKSSRRPLSAAVPVQRCAIVGAGLAGASVAATLAQRGWSVQVLDQAAAPASGASALPVGLVVPHVSSDDCVLSRLSRAGVRLMLQEATRYLQHGVDWAASGVWERQIGNTPQLPGNWNRIGEEWCRHIANPSDADGQAIGAAVWHPKAAWVKPAALVRAWLNHGNISFLGQTRVAGLRRVDSVWQLHDENDQVCAQAEQVVLANAGGAHALLQNAARQNPGLANALKHLPTVHGLRGLLSWGLHASIPVPEASFPQVPVNGAGALIAHIPTNQGPAWFMGSSYQPTTQVERSDHDNHLRNLAHLQQLDPTLANGLASAFQDGTAQAWKGTRCVSTDRLPLIGPLDDGDSASLWLCAAMGSRGLSFSVLCAQILAARMGAEPLPVPVKMAQALAALRV